MHSAMWREMQTENVLEKGCSQQELTMDQFNYSFHRTRDWKHYEVYLKRFRGNPSPLLELGSGIGLFLEACRENSVHAIGLEYEQEGVQAARERGLDALQHDLSFPLPFPDSSFQTVFSNQVIEHLSKPTQLLMISETFRVLRPGGQALIISPCRHYEPARLDKYHIGLLTPSELRIMAENAGFVNVNMGYNRMQSIAPSVDPILKPLFEKEHFDLLSQDACILAWKPLELRRER